jgi:hypothetical protein
MRALADALFAALAILVALALVGDKIAALVGTLAVPLGVLLVGLIAARLVWFYTRW